MLNEYLNQVTVGDHLELLPNLPDSCIDLTVTSPPYDSIREYKGYTFIFDRLAKELYRVTKEGGIVVWIVGDETVDSNKSGTSFRQCLYFRDVLGFLLYDTIIYSKSGFRFPRPRAYHNTHEYMFILSKGIPNTVNLLMDRKNIHNEANKKARNHFKREKDGKFTGRKAFAPREFGVRYNIWDYDTVGHSVTDDKFAYEHPAIFPEALARDHILSWSNPGDIVLDPMAGSGTTLKMAKELGRQFIGLEVSEEYAEIARRRVETANVPLFVMDERNEMPLLQTG